MAFAHQRLAVYRYSIDLDAWSHKLLHGVDAARSTRTELERASTGIPLMFAERNVESSRRDRRGYLTIALDSAAECTAILDVPAARRLRDADDVAGGEDSLVRIVSMLMTLVQGIDEDGRATITITSRG